MTCKAFTSARERFEEIHAEAGARADLLLYARSLGDGQDCRLWITGKAEPGAGRRIMRALPPGAMVLNFSVPDPLTPRLESRRVDVIHMDGGLLGYSSEDMDLRFTMRLKYGLTYACHAATMVHAMMGWIHHEVGPVDPGDIPRVWEAALNCGFYLPKPTSHLLEVCLPLQHAEAEGTDGNVISFRR